jgi:SOS-response transcriptional repressor LexA
MNAVSQSADPAVIRDILDRGAAVRIRVTGRSMRPILCPGDIVVVRPADEVARGDIVAVLDTHGRLIVHRITKIDGDTIVTQGDAVHLEDPPAARSAVIGRVEERMRDSGSTDFRSRRWQFAGRSIAMTRRVGVDRLVLGPMRRFGQE